MSWVGDRGTIFPPPGSWLSLVLIQACQEFSEAAAATLSLPSPACKDRIGEVVRGRVKVEKYGDSVQATNVEGDHY
jgi:hypothetical protein